MQLLDGKITSELIEENLSSSLKKIREKLKLSVILVGNDPASVIYVNMKKKKCENMGIACEILHLPKQTEESKILEKINSLNNKRDVTAILVQLPLPENLNARRILDSVDVNKDVDGLNSYNLTRILLGREKIIPCTPKGILLLLENYNIEIEGKNICVVGFGDVVGKPLATLCLNRGATVTVCHKKTRNLKEHTLRSDIIMTAVGVPNLITKEMVREGAIVVDIGISRVDGKVCGDVDFDNVKNKCSFITPVPGGVGPMTVISLIDNILELNNIQKN